MAPSWSGCRMVPSCSLLVSNTPLWGSVRLPGLPGEVGLRQSSSIYLTAWLLGCLPAADLPVPWNELHIRATTRVSQNTEATKFNEFSWKKYQYFLFNQVPFSGKICNWYKCLYLRKGLEIPVWISGTIKELILVDISSVAFWRNVFSPTLKTLPGVVIFVAL